MRKELADILSRNRPQLVENIDPENGILNDLISMNVLTRRQAKTIEVIPDPYKQVETLLDMLRRRPDEDFDKFCEALCKHGQEEVVSSYLKLDDSKDIEALDEKQSTDEKQDTFSKTEFGSTERPTVLSSLGIKIQNATLEFYNQYKDASYPMCNSNRGRCIIFNVEIVKGMARREGSEGDLRNLKELFRQLHFTTETFTNPTARDITDKVAEISSDTGLVHDQCLVMFFLSHGRINTTMSREGPINVEHIYGSDGIPVRMESILEHFTNVRCPALNGKPKLFFIQACREYSKVGFQEVSHATEAKGKDSSDAKGKDSSDALVGTEEEAQCSMFSESASSSLSYSFPSSSLNKVPISLKDFIIGSSTESGHPSFRDIHAGSWYINAIVKVFTESAHNMDVCAMLRKVNGIIAEWKPMGLGIDSRLSQVASQTDSLTKPYLFFFPGITTES